MIGKNFINSVYGRLCNTLFSIVSFFPFFPSLSISWPILRIPWLVMPINMKRKQRSENEAEKNTSYLTQK